MGKIVLRSLLVAYICLFSPHIFAQNSLIPAPPQLAAKAYLLIDAHSNKVLVEKDADQTFPPASLTKMMTTYLVEAALKDGSVKMHDQVPVSVKAWRTGGSKMFIREGTKVSLEDLLRGINIQSGNDASIALAEYLAGSEAAFVELMNRHAKLIGMHSTQFINAHGLPEKNSQDHYSTARDLAVLAQRLIFDFPETYPIHKEKEFTFNNIKQYNRNRLLWRDKSVDGIKTGHTEEAGFCLVASAERDGMRLISVVMGAGSEDSRAIESQKLLNYGFRYFETHKLYSAGETIQQARVWAGEAEQVQLGLSEDVHISIPKGKQGSLDIQIDIDQYLEAPIPTGSELGQVKVLLDGELLADEPIYSLQEVKTAGFFARFWDQIKLFFIRLFA